MNIVLTVIVAVVISGLIRGWLIMRTSKKSLKYVCFGISLVLLTGFIFWGVNLMMPHAASAAEIVKDSAGSNNSLGYLAAGLAVGIASIGAGIAVGIAGAAAIGAIAEKPEILGRALIIIGLAEGIAIYGLIISIMILSRL